MLIAIKGGNCMVSFSAANIGLTYMK